MAPKLARKLSLLDTNWSEKIATEALNEIFVVFKRVIDDLGRIELHREAILKQRRYFSGKAEKGLK